VEAVHTTMPYSVAVYMVRALLSKDGTATPDEAAVGWSTGVLAAAFSFAQFLTSMLWGRVSDSVGRKPIVIMSALSSGLSAVAFGVAPSFWTACAARACGGLFNATFGALKSVIAEACAAAGVGQTASMSLLALSWGMGTIVGPALGGLASPCAAGGGDGGGRRATGGAPAPATSSLLARAWPGGCTPHTGLWVRHPFLPPCLVAATFSVAALAVSLFVLEETLPAHRRRSSGSATCSTLLARLPSSLPSGLARAARGRALGRLTTLSSPYVGPAAVEEGSGGGPGGLEMVSRPRGVGEGEHASLLGAAPDGKAALDPGPTPSTTTSAPTTPTPNPPWYRQPPVLYALAGYGSTAALFNLIDELLPVFASAPLAAGGLGLTPAELAAALGVGGAALIVVARWGYRAIHVRVGTLACARAGLGGAVPLCLALPLPSLLPGGGSSSARVLALSLLLAARSLAANLAFTAAMLSINVAAPPGDVGLVNGAGQTIASFVRAAGPAAGGVLWGAASLLRPGGQFLPFALVAAAMAAAARLFHHVTPPPDEVALFHGGGGGGAAAAGTRADEEEAEVEAEVFVPGGPPARAADTIPAAWAESEGAGGPGGPSPARG